MKHETLNSNSQKCFRFQVLSFMSIFDFLKRKKEVERSKEKRPEKTSVPEKTKKVPEIQTQKRADIKAERRRKVKEGSFSYEAVKEPHISEKATYLGESNKYVFKVYNNVNKPEIKKAVEGIYGADVLSVNVIKIPKKKRRIGRTEGFKKGYSKAVVTVKEGQKIEIL